MATVVEPEEERRQFRDGGSLMPDHLSHPVESPPIDWLRALRQQLDSLHRAGMSHLPRALPPSTSPLLAEQMSAAVSAAMPTRDSGMSPESQVAALGPAKSQTLSGPLPDRSSSNFPRADSPQAEEPEDSLMKIAKSRSSTSSTPAAADSSSRAAPPARLSLPQRVAQLQVLADKVAGCRRCEELASTRTQTVFGVGNPRAKILFIGEAPGADEDRQGEPFVGRAGQLLNKIIEASKLKREDLYICNVLKCRPPENRTPEPPECNNCREYLDGQISIIDPDYIVCWGGVASQNLLQSTLTIGRLRGKFQTYGRAKVLCTYHPSYLMRNPSAKKDVWEDMKSLMADMGVDL